VQFWRKTGIATPITGKTVQTIGRIAQTIGKIAPITGKTVQTNRVVTDVKLLNNRSFVVPETSGKAEELVDQGR
jgi:hypothetical protein